MPAAFGQLLTGGHETIPFQPFRDGVEIAPLLAMPDDASPAVALIRYAPGAAVPAHEHLGTETICVLSGAQSDDAGTYRAGDVVVNEAGSRHRVWSDEGCVVLVSWAAPVRFIEAAE